MTSLKRWIFSIFLAGFLALTISAGVEAHQHRVEVDQARDAILGTLICTKTGEQTWAGSTKLERPYSLAHGVVLIQPNSQIEPWKEVSVRGTFRPDGTDDPVEFERSSDFWAKEGRNEFFVSYPMAQTGTLSVEISGVKASGTELRLDVANMLCGCERMVGDFVTFVAWAAGFISVVLAVFTANAFTRKPVSTGVQAG
jgi:hypothetical protein